MDLNMQRTTAAAANWAAMDADILCSIFSRLPFVDLLRVKSICWGWNNTVDLFESCSKTSSFPELPWLILPPLEDEEFIEGEEVGRFGDVEEEKTYPFNNLALKKMNGGGGGCYCIGSSHDWLICLDRKALPFLLNPFTAHRLDLPIFDLSLGVELVDENGSDLEMVDGGLIARVNFVKRAILSSSPTLSRNYYVVIIYGFDLQLAFCKDGDTSWTKLDYNANQDYLDINFHDNQLYGIYVDEDAQGLYLRIWDANQRGFLFVRKVNNILPPASSSTLFNGLVSISFYLVESLGNLLVVSRVVYGDDTTNPKPSSENRLDFGGYRTSKFDVFKLDMDQNSCERVKSLCGIALFLGRNQSMSVDVRSCKMFKQDSIYFTDDYQGLGENIVDYSGHDSGVFDLKGNYVDRLSVNKAMNGKSGPTWVSPFTKRLN